MIGKRLKVLKIHLIYNMFKKKKNDLTEVVNKGIIAAFLEIGYILFAAAFLFLSQTLFHPGSKSIIFGITASLILIVTSVAVSGFLVLGYPAHYFLEKKYKEGVVFLCSCLATLVIVFTLIILGEIFIY